MVLARSYQHQATTIANCLSQLNEQSKCDINMNLQ